MNHYILIRNVIDVSLLGKFLPVKKFTVNIINFFLPINYFLPQTILCGPSYQIQLNTSTLNFN